MDGGWTDWKDWTPCSQTCGTGSQERVRSCTQPRPAFGGKDCVGVSRETKSCQARVCPGKIMVLTFSTEAWLPKGNHASVENVKYQVIPRVHVSIFVSFIFQYSCTLLHLEDVCFYGFAAVFPQFTENVLLGPNSYQSSPTFLSFENPTVLFASQHNLFRTM